jgi:hypothetical protein
LKVLLNRRQAWGEKLDPKEEALLAVWAVDPESVAFSDQEAARFEKDLRATLEDLRVRHLAGGSLSQVQMVARGLKEQLELTQDLLGKDLSALKSLESRLKERRQPLQATRASLRQTLEGAGQRLKKVLKDRVSRVLDRHSGQVGAALTGFINAYEPDWGRLVPPGATAATFRPMLYQLFQDLLKELTHFVAAEVNVSLVEFIREQEEWLRQELARAGAPLLLSLKEALSLYYLEMEALGLPFTPPALEMAANPRPENLEVPLLTLEFDPGWWWTGEVWVLAGAGFLGRAWVAVKRRLGLGKGEPQGPLLRDLGRALKTIKNWLKAQVKVQMIDYQERLKFRYFLPLVDQWLQEQENHLDNTLGSLFADLEGVTGAMHLQEEERAVRRRRLGEMIPAVKEMEMQLAAGG